jgi:hypothetical protein
MGRRETNIDVDPIQTGMEAKVIDMKSTHLRYQINFSSIAPSKLSRVEPTVFFLAVSLYAHTCILCISPKANVLHIPIVLI